MLCHLEDSRATICSILSCESGEMFMRFFREETGMTFTAYLLDYRIRCAAFLLRESGGSVGEIALDCGFHNFSYFSRSFNKRFGLSPRQYRNGGFSGSPALNS